MYKKEGTPIFLIEIPCHRKKTMWMFEVNKGSEENKKKCPCAARWGRDFKWIQNAYIIIILPAMAWLLSIVLYHTLLIIVDALHWWFHHRIMELLFVRRRNVMVCNLFWMLCICWKVLSWIQLCSTIIKKLVNILLNHTINSYYSCCHVYVFMCNLKICDLGYCDHHYIFIHWDKTWLKTK